MLERSEASLIKDVMKISRKRKNRLGRRIVGLILTLALVFYGVPLDFFCPTCPKRNFGQGEAEAAGEGWLTGYGINGCVSYDDGDQYKARLIQKQEKLLRQLTFLSFITSLVRMDQNTQEGKDNKEYTQCDLQTIGKLSKEITGQTNYKNTLGQISQEFRNKLLSKFTERLHSLDILFTTMPHNQLCVKGKMSSENQTPKNEAMRENMDFQVSRSDPVVIPERGD